MSQNPYGYGGGGGYRPPPGYTPQGQPQYPQGQPQYPPQPGQYPGAQQ